LPENATHDPRLGLEARPLYLFKYIDALIKLVLTFTLNVLVNKPYLKSLLAVKWSKF